MTSIDADPIAQGLPVGPGAVALLERRNGMNADLFKRYWRDVHGVLATRIPGFDRYTQFHTLRTPVFQSPGHVAPFAIDGIAEVVIGVATNGLSGSAVSEQIRLDEQNVFDHALLSAQPAGSSQVWSDVDDLESRDGSTLFEACDDYFLLLQSTPTLVDVQAQLITLLQSLVATPAVTIRRSHFLSAGDTAWWDTPNVANASTGAPYTAAVRLAVSGTPDWTGIGLSVERALGQTGPIAIHRVSARYVMVANGVPTELGLRGLDPLLTIVEAGAVNQRNADLLSLIYK